MGRVQNRGRCDPGLNPVPITELAVEVNDESGEVLLGQCADCERLVVVGEDLRCADCGGERVELCAGESVLVEDVVVCPADSLESDAGMD